MWAKELTRILRPFPIGEVLAALDGNPSIFDKDGVWHPHQHGPPRLSDRSQTAFDGAALVAGTVSCCYLSAQLPVGDPTRNSILGLVERMTKRLSNTGLLLGGGSIGHGDGTDLYLSDGFVPMGTSLQSALVKESYTYYRPAHLSQSSEHEELATRCYPLWSDTFGWTSTFRVFRFFRSRPFREILSRIKDTPLSTGQWESNPKHSASALVAEASSKLSVNEDAAILYLQLLTLCDWRASLRPAFAVRRGCPSLHRGLSCRGRPQSIARRTS